jgi:biopolymer transport protein ExbD
MRTLVAVFGLLVSSFVVGGVGAQSSASFVLNVDRQGSFSIDEDGASLRLDESSIVEHVVAALRRDAATALFVDADPGAPRASVIRAAQLLQQGGATRVGFRTRSADRP